MNKAFFLDRDGTLNVDFDYVHLPTQWQWCERAVESIRWMNQHGFLTIVVTNQSGISRGKYSLDQVNELHRWVDAELEKEGAFIDRWMIAPYHPDYHDGQDPELIRYRKPGIGMFEAAKKEFNIDYSQSMMIGDKVSDLEPALELGLRPFFVRSVHEMNQDRNWIVTHNIPIVDNVGDVISILGSELQLS
jgi:D-glycero-D-manno-heptose 1,7-bisphosphate phosphatase